MKKKKNKIKKLLLAIILFTLINAINIFASGIQGTSLYTGTMHLLNDGTTALLVILPVAGALLFIWFQIKKMGADQNEQPMWSKRQKIVLTGIISGETIVAVINTLVSYYR